MLYLPIGWFCSLSKSPCFCPIQDFTDFSDESNGFRQFRHSPWQFDHHCQNYIHPWNLTWNLKITCLKRKLIFQTFIFGFHVNFQGCNGMFDNSSNQNGINLDSDMIHPVLHQHKSDDFSPSLAASFPSGTSWATSWSICWRAAAEELWRRPENPSLRWEEKPIIIHLATINRNWVVVSNIYYFHPSLGKSSNLTTIFLQTGWWKTTKLDN